MADPARKTVLWVIATLCLAMLPQVLNMPPAVTMMALLPIAWRIGAELRVVNYLVAWSR